MMQNISPMAMVFSADVRWNRRCVRNAVAASSWALASSPFILGTDITNLDPGDLALLKNTDVLAVDQDAIDATRAYNSGGQQVFTKQEPNGDVIAGLFNTSGAAQSISTSASALGLPGGTDYFVKDLWTHQTTETAGAIDTVETKESKR